MATDTSSIQLLHFGVMLNLIGLGAPLAISLAVSYFYRESFFRFWTASYLAFLITIAMSFWVGHALYGIPAYVIAVASHVLGTAWLSQVAFKLHEREPSRTLFYGLIVLLLGHGSLMAALGQPLAAALAPSLLANLLAHLYLGWVLIRRSPTSGRRGFTATWLGVASLATGLLSPLYPLAVRAHVEWVGYATAGLIHLFVGIGMVVYMLERISERLREQHAELAVLDKAKSNFIATINHELRTPLTVICAGIELVKDQTVGPITPEQDNLLGSALDQADGLMGLLTSVLDFSRIEAGVMTYRLRPGNLLDCVRQAVENFEAIAQRHQIALALQSDLNTLQAKFDHDRIWQVLNNLLSNACKFTPSGGTVLVRVSCQSDRARIEVEDTGRGIAPENLDRIFAVFYQEDGSPTRSVNGTGLGLAICKAIVEDGHSGRIWAESTPGEGSHFIVELPLQAVARPRPPRQTVSTRDFVP